MQLHQRISGAINTAVRVAFAREKARALGLGIGRASPLQRAAAALEERRKPRAKKTEDELLTISHQAETHAFSLRRVKLQTKDPKPEAEDDVTWKAYIPGKQEKNPRPRRMGSIAVMSMAQQLIWSERGSGRSRVARDPGARALEEAARRWQREHPENGMVVGSKR